MWQWTSGAELYHYGIKGQKWGVRRYQNEDGTLTAAGKRRQKMINIANNPENNFTDRRIAKAATRTPEQRVGVAVGKTVAGAAAAPLLVKGLGKMTVMPVMVETNPLKMTPEAKKKYYTNLGKSVVKTYAVQEISTLILSRRYDDDGDLKKK